MPYHSDEKNSPMGVDKKLTQKQMEKLLEHSKKHKGGMRSKHMRDMIKHMKKGDTFSTAHNKAMGKKGEVVLDGKKITFKEGALRNQLKMPEDRKFTKSELNKLKNIENGKEFNFLGNKFKMTPLLKKRITFGLTLMGNK